MFYCDLIRRLLQYFLLPLALRTYFKKISVEGKDNYDSEGATLLAVNHPNSFIDPLLVTSILFGNLYYLTAAEYMGKGIKNWFMRKEFHMVPVYRPSVFADTKGNSDMFKECSDLLKDSKMLLVHPEGDSVKRLKIQPLKTGLARIAIGTKQKYPQLPIKIIPIGLNFTNHHQAFSDVHIKINAGFFLEHTENTSDNIKTLTEKIEDEMKKTVIHLENETAEINYWRFFRLLPSWRFFENDEKTFSHQKSIADRLNDLSNDDNQEFKKLSTQAEYLEKKLLSLGINKINKIETEFSSLKYILLVGFVLLFPVFLVGRLFHFVPISLIRPIRKKIKTKPSFKGSMIIALGLFLNLFWYVIVGVVFAIIFGSKYLILLPVLLIIGRISTVYLIKWDTFYKKWKQYNISKKHAFYNSDLMEWQKQVDSFFN